MGLFDKLFGRKKQSAPSTSELARERLTLMLVHDRLKLTPDLLDRIKEELLAVISKYVEIDEAGVDVELTHTEHSDKLVARMPVRRQRLHFERDVLEPGMGNPLVAAAALAGIHQSPADAASAPAVPAPETASASAAPAAAAPAEQGEKEVTSAETPAAAEPAVSDAPTAQATAEAEQSTATEAASAPDAPQDIPASTSAVNAAPTADSTPVASAAEGSAHTEAPAPAATPTKG